MEWSQLIPLGSGLVGTIIGGGIAYFTQMQTRREERVQKRTSLAIGIAAEIEAYLALMERRGHLALARRIADQPEVTTSDMRGWITPFDLEHEAFPFTTKSIGDLGLLGGLAGDVTKFLMGVYGIKSTMSRAEHGGYDAHDSETRRCIVSGEADFWVEIVTDAHQLIAALRKVK